ncbi:hypothetical protein QJQ45_012366 [Haematococcus lacustris]|nr:hypothetical protein QJQ45_012366 [Haematococcus lacustris]
MQVPDRLDAGMLAFTGDDAAAATATTIPPAGKLLSRSPRKLLQSPSPALDSEDCWQPLEASPPPIPSDYRLLASQELSCSVQDYYHTVLAGTATFLEAYHRQDGSNLAAQGRSVFEATLGLAGSSGFVRSLHFTQPRKAPNPRDADCVQRQQFAVFQGEGQQAGMPGPELLFATVMNTLQAPFHDCYTVNTITSVRPSVPRGDGREAASCGCCVFVYVQVLGKSRPRDRQMRVMVVVLLLLGSLLHQALLHYDMDSIRQQLASVGMQV